MYPLDYSHVTKAYTNSMSNALSGILLFDLTIARTKQTARI